MSTPTAYGRLAAALAEMTSPKADKVNPAYKSKYASLDCIMDTVRPILAKHGLAIMQIPYNSEGRVGIKTVIVHSEGLIELGGIDVATKPETKAQDVGAALTYLRRQTVQAAMGIATDLDDDGNSISGAAASTEPAARSWGKGAARG